MKAAKGETVSTEVLLVEDSSGDVRLTKEAFLGANPSVRLHVAGDGLEAIEFLRREKAYAAAPRPDLIVLDLNLPKMEGGKVLALIKQDANLKAIPVVVLSASAAQEVISETYRLHANCYLIKPADMNQFFSVVKSIDDFWLARAKLPSETAK
jgi:two-component system, chemotaxis family, response regulator Rcp1